MIERKDKYIRIRVIGGSGIFDSILNILKKPIVSKLLTSAGKSVASVLGERLVNRMLPTVQPTASVVQQSTPLTQPTASVVQPTSTRAQELISRYKAKHVQGSGISTSSVPTTTSCLPLTI